VRATLIALGEAATVAAGALTWCWLGDQSEAHGDYDGRFQGPIFDRQTEVGLARMAGVTVVLVAVLTDIAGRHLGHPREVWKMTVALLALGAFVGGALRIITARTVGANIGAGILVLTGPFVAGALLLVAVRERRKALSRAAPPSAPA
jgi:hypothetical protein